jgi:hypothetical protein
VILFGCQDVGPAKYLAELTNSFPDSLLVCSNLSRPYFSHLTEIDVDAMRDFKNLKLVVLGTSLGDEKLSLEKRIIKEAKRLSIPSVAVIEHWSWYNKRFETKAGHIFPDYIILNDSYAMTEAINDGLPKSRLKVLGNPYLESLCLKNFNSFRNSTDLKSKYCLPTDKRIIIFISEELCNTFKKGTDDYLGYDEFGVLNDLKSVLSPLDHLVLKLHPEEDFHKYDSFIDEKTSVIGGCSLQDLISITDIFVGMASMLLLEVALFRCDVISYRPNSRKEFIGERLGATVPAQNIHQLSQSINGTRNHDSNFGLRFKGSKNRITSFLKDTIK